MRGLTELTREQVAQALELYEGGNGMLVKEIAALIGTSSQRVNALLRSHGFEQPTNNRCVNKSPPIHEEVNRLWGDGFCATQIAERLSVNLGRVNCALAKLGVRDSKTKRHRYDGSGASGGVGRGGGFAGAFARRT